MEPQVEREALKQNVEQAPSIIPASVTLGDSGDRVWVRIK